MSGSVTESRAKIVDVIKVERSGDKIVVPERVPIPTAILALQRALQAEETIVEVVHHFDGFAAEAAYALVTVLEEKFGFVDAVAQQDMWGGDRPPVMWTINVGLNETKQVPLSDFRVPGIEGVLTSQIGPHPKTGLACLILSAQVKQKHKTAVEEIVNLTTSQMRANPIYGGKAWRIRFRDERGEYLKMPSPEFFALRPEVVNHIKFNADIQASVNINLLALIRYGDACRDRGTNLKRGVLIAGDYGTGKSLLAHQVAVEAVANGVTFIAVERADELADALKLAEFYPKSVVFSEDVDQVVSGDRSIGMNDILNIIDGVESKSSEVIIVLTTNHPEEINPAMLRPGRLDSIISVEPPDAGTVVELVRTYGGDQLEDGIDLTKIGEMLAGQKAAIVREAVERAKLAEVFESKGSEPRKIKVDDLYAAALSLQNEQKYRDPSTKRELSNVERAAMIYGIASADPTAVASMALNDHVYDHFPNFDGDRP